MSRWTYPSFSITAGAKDEGIKVRGGGEKMGERRVETPPEKYHARDNAKRHLS
jgi:hypothetical protein